MFCQGWAVASYRLSDSEYIYLHFLLLLVVRYVQRDIILDEIEIIEQPTALVYWVPILNWCHYEGFMVSKYFIVIPFWQIRYWIGLRRPREMCYIKKIFLGSFCLLIGLEG